MKEFQMVSFIRKNPGWSLLALFTMLMTAVTLLTALGILREQKQFANQIVLTLYYPALFIHIGVATIAVIIGLFQFLPQIRAKRIDIHRFLGRTYMLCILVSGLTATYVVFFTERFDEQIAFATLDVLWLFTAWKAYRAIRRKQIAQHRLWIVRNYAVTLAAIFARLVVPLMIPILLLKGPLPAGGFDTVLPQILGTGVWLTLVIDLTIADWLVNRSQKLNKGLLALPETKI
jgi:uncharacterized membrane protein